MSKPYTYEFNARLKHATYGEGRVFMRYFDDDNEEVVWVKFDSGRSEGFYPHEVQEVR